jgi:hypothetical protein
MLAEIFMLRAEATLRVTANEPRNYDPRFAPVALPRTDGRPTKTTSAR